MLLCNLNILQLTEHKALHQMCLNLCLLHQNELKCLSRIGGETGNAVGFLRSFYCIWVRPLLYWHSTYWEFLRQQSLPKNSCQSFILEACMLYKCVYMCMYAYVSDLLWQVTFTLTPKWWKIEQVPVIVLMGFPAAKEFWLFERVWTRNKRILGSLGWHWPLWQIFSGLSPSSLQASDCLSF